MFSKPYQRSREYLLCSSFQAWCGHKEWIILPLTGGSWDTWDKWGSDETDGTSSDSRYKNYSFHQNQNCNYRSNCMKGWTNSNKDDYDDKWNDNKLFWFFTIIRAAYTVVENITSTNYSATITFTLTPRNYIQSLSLISVTGRGF